MMQQDIRFPLVHLNMHKTVLYYSKCEFFECLTEFVCVCVCVYACLHVCVLESSLDPRLSLHETWRLVMKVEYVPLLALL